jgi:uncharacterized protein (DUF302 family)
MKRTSGGVAFEVISALDYEAAVAKARAELAREGFGVLTEIDVQATMKKKLDIDRDPYVILGACNPPLAHRALDAVPEIGVLLPCNVTVSVEQGRTVVRAMNPEAAMAVVENDAIADVGRQVGAALERVVNACRG